VCSDILHFEQQQKFLNFNVWYIDIEEQNNVTEKPGRFSFAGCWQRSVSMLNYKKYFPTLKPAGDEFRQISGDQKVSILKSRSSGL
jgi:hypothetical protein